MGDRLENGVVDQLDTAQEITKQFLDNDDFANTVLGAYMLLLQTDGPQKRQRPAQVTTATTAR